MLVLIRTLKGTSHTKMCVRILQKTGPSKKKKKKGVFLPLSNIDRIRGVDVDAFSPSLKAILAKQSCAKNRQACTGGICTKNS